MIRAALRPLTWLASLATAVRDWQQDALREMQRLDAAVALHMQHGAMAGNDPLTDSIFDQADAAAACALEGAVPPLATGAGLTMQQLEALADSQCDDRWLDLLMPGAITVAVLAYLGHCMGWW